LIDPALETDQAAAAFFERVVGRRGFLAGSASGLLLLAVGSLLPSGCRGYPEPPVPLHFFNAEEYAIFQGVAHAILGLEESEADVAAEVDRFVSHMTKAIKRDIRWMLRIFEHGTHLFDLKGRRFSSLSRKDQEQYLSGWMNSSMGARRMVFRALKLLAALGYYGRADTWTAIGYDGPWLGRRSEERRFSYEKPLPLPPA
jgi:hypothetical protein